MSLPAKWEKLRRVTETMRDPGSAAGIRGDVLLELLADLDEALATGSTAKTIATDPHGRVYLTDGFVLTLNARFDTLERLIGAQTIPKGTE